MLKRLTFASILLCLSAVVANAFWQSRDSNYNISLAGGSNNLITPIFSTTLPTNGSATTFHGAFATGGDTTAGGINSGAAVRRTVVPFNATISNLLANTGASQASATVTLNVNGTDQALTCTFTTTLCTDSTHVVTVNAGDIVQWTLNPHGTWAQTVPMQISVLVTSTGGQQAALLLGSSGSGLSSAIGYYNPQGLEVQTSIEASNSGLFTIAGQITGIYVIPNTADTGANFHTYTLCHNGTSVCSTPGAGIACVGSSDALGCCANTTATGNIGGVKACSATPVTPITIAAGDTLSIAVSCGGTCSTVNPGIGIIFVPNTSNQVPLFVESTSVPSPSGFYALSSNPSSASSTVQTNWNATPSLVTPSSMTFSNYWACSQFNPGGVTTRVVALQESASLIAPATNAGPLATLSVANGACPGAFSATLLGGFADTTHTFVAGAGYSLDTATTLTGTPAASGAFKIGMAVTVP